VGEADIGVYPPDKPPVGDRKARWIIILAAVVVFVFVVLPILTVVGIVMWQLVIFNVQGPGATTSIGFSKIKPQLAAADFTRNGEFTGTFTNGVGARIRVYEPGVSVSQPNGPGCASVQVDRSDVPAGDNFRITASGCPAGGDVYSVQVKIPYNLTIGGITTSHTDTGTIRGPVL